MKKSWAVDRCNQTNHDNSDFTGNVQILVMSPKAISYAKCRVNVGHYLGIKPLFVIFKLYL